MQIAIVSGSSRPNRLSHQVALELANRINAIENTSAWLFDVLEERLPLLDATYASQDSPSTRLEELSTKLEDSDGFIIVSPEWNGTFPGGLKNSMDYFLPQYKKKAFGIIGVSAGVLGGINAAKNLVTYCQHLKGIVSPSLLITPSVGKLFTDGSLTDESYAKRLDTFLSEFLWLANALHSAK